MSDDEKPEEMKTDEVDKSSVVSDVHDNTSTSTYSTALEDEEVDSAPPSTSSIDVTVKQEAPEDDVTANGTEDVEDEVDRNHDNEGDDEGHVSDDQRSIVSSVGASSGSQVPDTEREDGDGQEEGDKKDKKLDHDEDRRDPQYIPKRGVFYEHDDRTCDDDKEEKKEPVREPRKSKPFEAVERWGHDMYNEDEQSPKTTDELVDMYGYDIRKEEGPPKARRRRRYGKGPNKYQRSWEDEQAYNKTPTRGGFKGQKRPPRNYVQREEDFPVLKSNIEDVLKSNIEDVPAAPPTGDTAPIPTVKFLSKLPPKDDQLMSKEEIKAIFDQLDEEERLKSSAISTRFVRHSTKERSERSSRTDSGRGRPSMSRRGRSGHELPPFAGRRSEQSDRPSEKHGKGKSTADEDIATLAQHFSNAVINVDKNIAPIRSTSEPPTEERPSRDTRRDEGKHQSHQKHPIPQTDKNHQPPEQPSKSKRYSTQRQRPPQMNSGSPAGAPPAQAPPTAPGYLPPQQGYYPPQHGMCPPEGTPHLAAPPPAQFPPPPGGMQMMAFLPTVPPPPTNAFHPPPNVYVPPAPYIPPPPIVAQTQPAEVYQGGVTYYNTQSQVLPRAAPSRRVKLAIPIVSPDNSQPIQ